MAENEITKKWIIDMMKFVKKKKLSNSAAVMLTSDNYEYIVFDDGRLFECKPVELPILLARNTDVVVCTNRENLSFNPDFIYS